MFVHSQHANNVLKSFESNGKTGLSIPQIEKSRQKFGSNILTKQKKKSIAEKIFSSLKEPLMVILVISFIIAFGTSLGKFFKTGEGDFAESLGVLFAIVLSVSITLIMEGSSERAFSAISKIYDNITVRAVRDGVIVVMNQAEVVVGDVIMIESGDKIVADGRLIESEGLTLNESALTGESNPVKKQADAVLNQSTPLAERINCVYSGTFVSSGVGKMVVTAIGDGTEIGNIAGELKEKDKIQSPLEQKLAKLGKVISIIGAVCAGLVFVVSLIKLIVAGGVNFESIQELFISCIILIVAAVPEGLPTIVAVSLALNMIKLARENALIKKMIATETAGAVSVICSDKTGTLTKNQMSVVSICSGEYCVNSEKALTETLVQNFVLNSTADIINSGKEITYRGSGTESALLSYVIKKGKVKNCTEYRREYLIVDRIPFNSDNKMMSTTVIVAGVERVLIKGAPEKILPQCKLSDLQQRKIIKDMEKHQKNARRILCFAHSDAKSDKFIYDGYAVLMDEIRPEVFSAIKECKRAGIKIKMLTGDNYVTAFAIAKELKIAESEREVISGGDLEKFDDETLKKLLPKISVIARSTPAIKSRIVRLLKELGEVVAVTGDGINDAPAIRRADVGIAMGKAGSEITKEAADVVLLDDSFSTIVKAISFGRNVYKNLQRFIMFQLSVNLSALLFVTISAFLGLKTPFNTLQLLWINIIMDGPPALTLGLEAGSANLMKAKPVERSGSIVSKKMLMKIAFNGIFVALILFLQYSFNFLKVSDLEKGSAIFTLFIMFQLFNAFNCRELGANSIFKGFAKNKIMLITFMIVFALQILIVQLFSPLFGIYPLGITSWFKILTTSSSIVVISEIYKFVYRIILTRKKFTASKMAFQNSKIINKKSIGA